MLDWVGSTNVLNKKMNLFFGEEIFVYIEIIPEFKNAMMREVVENSKKIEHQSSTLIHLSKYVL